MEGVENVEGPRVLVVWAPHISPSRYSEAIH